ncbi:hypothetical protein MMC11_007312 [Xylographa trunciseda]|nr:hypothetical protein [Xylographa trunciseda]
MEALNPAPIAIIGIGCRFPRDITNTEELWDLLAEGRNCWSNVPATRYNEKAFYHPDPDASGATNHRGGHFLAQDIAAFDASFFNISPTEAEAMDPQQRILLETSYEAFESGGLPMEGLRGTNTAVYIAMFTRDYDRNISKDPSDIPKYHTTGSGEAIISNRISHAFDLNGPSMTLDTGCSGSIVAVHQACQSLRTRESNLALAGGVNLILNPDHMIGMSNLHMLSDQGKSFSFDSRGSGYGRGEGVGTIVLKRLDDALRARDPIRAVICNTAVNQDGKTPGITLPSRPAQERLYRRVYEDVGIDPRDTGYVEAHGTGTVAGDLAEIEAIANVFCENRQTSLHVGSIKSNIGHLESSSGVAGLIKAVLVLEKGLIPPNANFETPKEELCLKDHKIRVPVKLEMLQGSGPNRVSVNSFGYGGTNAHIILEQAPVTTQNEVYCIKNDFTASNHEELLSALHEDKTHGGVHKASSDIDIGYVFTGQGAQWCGMGRELMLNSSGFKDSLLKSEIMLRNLGSTWGLIDELLLDQNATRIHQVHIAQPASTAIQIALVDLLHDMGIRPRVVLGHSSGEIAAAYAAGIISHAAALKIAYYRGFVSSSWIKTTSTKGGMLVTGLGERDVESYIADVKCGTVSVACINSPTSTTVSGDDVAINELKEVLDRLSIFNRKMHVDVAYHSHHMRAVSDEYLCSLKELEAETSPKSINFISSVTGTGKSSDFGPKYWAMDNLVSKVRFRDAIEEYCRQARGHSKQVLIEVGPHSALRGPTRQTIGNDFQDYSYFSALVRDRDAVQSILDLNGRLFVHGVPTRLDMIDSLKLKQSRKSVIQDLPSYPWDHSNTYWHESRLSKDYRLRPHPNHDLLGSRVTSSSSLEPRWRHIISVSSLPWLQEHVVDDLIVFPGAGYLCMAIEAVRESLEGSHPSQDILAFVIKNVSFSKALIVPEAPGRIEMQLSLNPRLGTREITPTTLQEFRICALSSDGKWYEHCCGQINVEIASSTYTDFVSFQHGVLEDIQLAEGSQSIGSEALYEQLRSNGNTYGDHFATITEIQLGNNCQAIAMIKVPDVAAIMPSNYIQPHIIHPTTLDALMHSSLPLYTQEYGPGAIMPVSIDEIVILPTIEKIAGNYLQSRATLAPNGPRSAKVDISVFGLDEAKGTKLRMQISGMELRGLGGAQQEALPSFDAARKIGHEMKWDVDVEFLSVSLPVSTLPKFAADSAERKLKLLNQAAIIYVSRVVNHSSSQSLEIPKYHHSDLVQWMKCSQTLFLASKHTEANTNDKYDEEDILNQARLLGVEGEMLSRLGPSMISILTGKTAPLEIMLEDDLLYRLYADDSSTRCYTHMAQYLKYLTFKNPSMTILELGGGTGGTTFPLLQVVSTGDTTCVGQYDFTDISAGFFDRARNLLREWGSLIHFQTLDIERDPMLQGFSKHSYDLVIASNVLHTTSNIGYTLENVHKLLKPGGRLILIELTRPQPYLNFIFGTLPGWSKGVDGRHQDSPILTESQWDKLLLHNSFTGVELAIEDIPGPAHVSTVMVTKTQTPDANDKVVLFPIKVIAGEEQSPAYQCPYIKRILEEFENNGYQVSLTSWQSYTLEQDVTYVVLDNGMKPFLTNPTTEEFRGISSLSREGSNVLWISAQDDMSAVMNPEKGLVTGLARTAHAENGNLNFVTLDVQQTWDDGGNRLLGVILQVLRRSFNDVPTTGLLREREYIYRNHQLLIPRLIPHSRLNEWMPQAAGKPQVEKAVYAQNERLLKPGLRKFDSVDRVIFSIDQMPTDPLDSFDVEIDVHAHGVSQEEATTVPGQSDLSSILSECSGVVMAVGQSCTALSIGDRVCAWGGEPLASRVRVHTNQVFQLPSSMSFIIGASIPIAFVSAHYSIHHLARLQKGQVILIHSAINDIGQAALILAQHIKATIIATVGSGAERDIICNRFSLPQDHVIYSETNLLRNRILGLTGGKGVDVILNCPTSKSRQENWDCLTYFGTIIQIEVGGKRASTELTTSSFDKNIRFMSFNMKILYRERPLEAARSLANVMMLFRDGLLNPKHNVISRSIADIGDVFRKLQADNQDGKYVLETKGNQVVDAIVSNHPKYTLDGDGTYLIAGGLGDLGQRLCRLIVGRGARHILVLSRRELDFQEQQAIEEELQQINAGSSFSTIVCDIADSLGVKRAVADIASRGLAPVKGVIQAATVLRVKINLPPDRTLRNMTLEDYQVPLQAKLHGTRNLYEAFENTPLDFFIMLSSAVGVLGTSGQANYSAGNVYQDAFASNQPNSKVHVTSLNIGMIEGAQASTQTRVDSLSRQGLIPIKPDELLAVFDYVLSGELSRVQSNQLIVGFDSQSISRTSNPNATSHSAMFSHIWHSAKKNAVISETASTSKSLADTISEMETPEVHAAITDAISRKISSLVTSGNAEWNPNLSIAELGMDSLIAIELKNWISREAQARLETSEILDQKSIMDLAIVVASRSKITRKASGSASSLIKNDKPGNSDSREELHTKYVSANPSGIVLPRLPVPELKSTLQLYLNSRQHFLSAEEFLRVSNTTKEFLKPNGLGHKLQQRLLARSEDQNIDCWQSDLYATPIYLRRRDPVHPFGTFYGGHLVAGVSHSQIERAAIISSAAFRFKQRIEQGTVEQDYMNEEPLCMNALQWLFNTCRKPCMTVDTMHKYPGNDYLVALRRGHIFKVSLTEGNVNVPILRLKAVFQTILSLSDQALPSVATLSADERDSWAQVRDLVRSTNSVNSVTIDVIEAAAFIVCLDDESPSTPSERCNQFFLGNPSNRWSDKNLQFVICKSGVSAFVGEHAMLDGASVRQLNRFVTNSILTDEFHNESSQDVGVNMKISKTENLGSFLLNPPLDDLMVELSFETNPVIEKHIGRVQEKFNGRFQPIELTHFRVDNFGTTFLRSHKCPSKPGYQMVIQLACLLYYGYQPPSWETISMARFHKGRIDWIQAVQPAVADFCAAARDDTITIAERRRLFFEAVNTHANTMTKIARGHGFVAHLYALREMLQDNEPLPALFSDQAWVETSVPSIKPVKTDCLEGMMMQETAFLMPEPQCIFVHFEVEENGYVALSSPRMIANDGAGRCLFFIQAWQGRTRAFCDALEEAATIVRVLLEDDEC